MKSPKVCITSRVRVANIADRNASCVEEARMTSIEDAQDAQDDRNRDDERRRVRLQARTPAGAEACKRCPRCRRFSATAASR